MKPRERVLAAFDHVEPDRVPLDFGGETSITRQAYVKLKQHLGYPMKAEQMDQYGVISTIDENILKLFNIDFRRVSLKPPTGWTMKRHPDGSLEDEWGLRFKEIGLYNEFIWNNPLKDIEDAGEIENHTWPDIEAPGRTEGLAKEAKKLEDAGWAVSTGTAGVIVGGLFEIAWWLRGYNNFMIDLYTQPKIVDALFDKILEVYIAIFDQYLGEVGDHVHMVMFTDDIGAQTQMIISPKLYRQYLKPRHKKLFDFIHSRTDARLFLHTCGSVDPVIPDLIEVGVDILNPVQPRAYGMESEKLKQKYGDKLCFHGGFDIQRVLPFGTPEEVEKEAHRRISAFAPGGGYVFAAAHNIQPDVPPQNIITMYKAAEKFGRYPINP